MFQLLISGSMIPSHRQNHVFHIVGVLPHCFPDNVAYQAFKLLLCHSFNIPLKWHQEQLGFIKAKKILWTKFTREVFIDLIHLQDDVIRNASFSQENIQLTRHTTSNWVDSKPISDGRIISVVTKLIYIRSHQLNDTICIIIRLLKRGTIEMFGFILK